MEKGGAHLARQQVDNLEGVLDDAHGHQLLAVVAGEAVVGEGERTDRPCIMREQVSRSTMGHDDLRKRFTWKRPAECGMYLAAFSFTAMWSCKDARNVSAF